MKMQTKDFKLELKAVNEDGTFEGYLSVYDVVDLGNDVVQKGAFTKTIQENKGKIPLLNNHKLDQDMGLLELHEDDHGLYVKGAMFINESALAKERHAMAKRYHEAGRPVGLSIGYEAVKKTMEKGIRQLKEVKLFEGSMTLWPMLPVAQISAIKTAPGAKDDFLTELDEAQTYAMRWMMFDALTCALCDIVYDLQFSAQEKIQLSAESIDQFRGAYIEFLPKLLTLWGEMEPGDMETASAKDRKVGRTLSQANRGLIEEAMSKLQALLDSADGTSEPEAADPGKAAAARSNEPDALHSSLSNMLGDFKSKLGIQ